MITVVAISNIALAEHAAAIDQTARCIPHPCRKLLISPTPVEGFDGEWKAVPDWMPGGHCDRDIWCRFLLYGLRHHVDSVCVVVQADGYALNPDRWTDDFLNYDYIGAPWGKSLKFVQSHPFHRVGNGGFTLRSRRWLDVASTLPEPPKHVMPFEDVYQSVLCADTFERAGCRIAPLALAMRWATEHRIEELPGWTIKDSFGFHGLGEKYADR